MIINKIILMGRLTRDPEVRYSQGENLQQLPDIHWLLTVDSSGKANRTQILLHAWHLERVQSSRRNISGRVQKLLLLEEYRLAAIQIRMGKKYIQQMLWLKSKNLQKASRTAKRIILETLPVKLRIMETAS